MNDPSLSPGAASGGRGDRARSDMGMGRNVAFSAARGAALVGLAVVIGIVLLQLIDDGTTGPIGDGGKGGSAAVTTTTTSGDGTTSTTSGSATVPPAQVSVLVLNGSGRPGAATAQTNALKAQGYQTLTPTDAAQRSGTVVYFKTGDERECTAVATAVGGAPKVQAIPAPPPAGSESANCVVVIGT